LKASYQFNEKNYRETRQVYIDSVYGGQLASSKRIIIGCCIGLLFGLGLFFLNPDNFLIAFLALPALYYIISTILFRLKVKKQIKLFNNKVNADCNTFRNDDSIINVEFDEHQIKFNDGWSSHEIEWEAFKYYKLIDNVIVLEKFDEQPCVLLLHREDTGSSFFIQLSRILSERIIRYRTGKESSEVADREDLLDN